MHNLAAAAVLALTNQLIFNLNLTAPKVFIIAGEASGDLHGGKLCQAIFRKFPKAQIQAWGGDQMALAGVEVLKHYRELAFMGFWEVLKNLKTILANFNQIRKEIDDFLPDCVILIDYPGFNMRLLKWLYYRKIKTYYYIAPQAWAWKPKRAYKLAKYVEKLFVILPFELEFFEKYGINTVFVGHPLLERIQSESAEPPENDKPTIALLPGSRKQEIEKILPILLSVVPHFPEYTFEIAGMGHLGNDFYQKFISGIPAVRLRLDDSENLLKKCQLALVASGTATLQTALYQKPQIVCYASGRINYWLAKRLINVQFISLVNLIMGREVVKELIQQNLNQTSLKEEIKRLLLPNTQQEIQQDYQTLRTKLSQKVASEEVVKEIFG